MLITFKMYFLKFIFCECEVQVFIYLFICDFLMQWRLNCTRTIYKIPVFSSDHMYCFSITKKNNWLIKFILINIQTSLTHFVMESTFCRYWSVFLHSLTLIKTNRRSSLHFATENTSGEQLPLSWYVTILTSIIQGRPKTWIHIIKVHRGLPQSVQTTSEILGSFTLNFVWNMK